MKNDEFKWITEVAKKLQSPLTYNERQKLTKIAVEALPAIIKALDESAKGTFGNNQLFDDGTEQWIAEGETCNGCGQDYWYKNPQKDRHWNGEKFSCEIENIHRILADLEEKSAK